MNLARSYHRTSGALIGLGLSAYATASGDGVLGLAVPAAMLAWWWTAASPDARTPRWLGHAALFAIAAYALYRVGTGGSSITTFARLVAIVQLVKILDRRHPRDDAQVLTLAVVLLIAAVLTDTSFWLGLQLIVALPVLVASVMLYQLYAGQHRVSATRRPRPASASRGASRDLTLAVSLATLGAVIFSAIIFVAVPRGLGQDPFAGAGGPFASRSVTGFTEEIRLGRRGTISESTRPVLDMRVQFRDGVGLGASGAVFYLRGGVLDRYSQGKWEWASTEPDGERKVITVQSAGANQSLPIGKGSDRTIEQFISVRDADAQKGRLFCMWRPTEIRLAASAPIRMNHSDRLMELGRDPPDGRLEYTVWSSLAETSPKLPTERTETQFPSERIHELASTILRDADIEPDPALRPIADDERAATQLERYLRSNYAYTLEEQAVPPGADPIEHFLFNTRQGHCEYFASALVAMLRSVGINARIITGYVAAEFNEATGHYIVRENNAHAWVEAELGKGRWRRFDATPPADLLRLHTPPSGIMNRALHLLDALQHLWSSSIVSFDESSRQRVLGGRRRSGDHRSIQDFMDRLRDSGAASATRALVAIIALLAIGVVVTAAFPGVRRLLRTKLARLGRGLAPARAAATDNSDAARLYRHLLDTLARRGCSKPLWRPPLQHAGDIALDDPSLARACREITNLYYRTRFGGLSPTPAELATAAQLLTSALASPSAEAARSA